MAARGGDELRIALTISGAVSLGAYEAGVLAALLTAVRALQKEQAGSGVSIDAIGGASAGALTAILAARVLTGGLDPVNSMYTAWVTNARLGGMFRGALNRSPLRIGNNLAAAKALLETEGVAADRQPAPVSVSLALCSLRGLHYRFPKLLTDGRRAKAQPSLSEADAITYLDWRSYVFTPAADATQFLAPAGSAAVDFALASGSNEFAFSPYWLCRPRQPYEDDQVDNFPVSGGYWYTDGGTIDNEPLGRTMDLAQQLDGAMPHAGHPFKRLYLLIHPYPSTPLTPADTQWADFANQPRWSATGLRALVLQRAQSLYNDMYAAEKVNSRVKWTQEFVEALVKAIPDELQSTVQQSLEGPLGELEERQRKLPHWRHGLAGSGDGGAQLPPATPQPAEKQDLKDVLWRFVRASTGFAEKNLVAIEQITPHLVDASRPLEDLLAGEILGSFGGFLDEDLRRSDFRLGFKSAQIWLENELGRYLPDPAPALMAVEAAAAKAPIADLPDKGATTVRQELLSRHGPQLLRLAIRYPWLLLADATSALLRLKRQGRDGEECPPAEPTAAA